MMMILKKLEKLFKGFQKDQAFLSKKVFIDGNRKISINDYYKDSKVDISDINYFT